MTLRPEDTLRPKGELAIISSDGRTTILDLDRPGEPARILEDSAAAIWGFIDGELTVAELCAATAAAYGVTAEVVAPDVIAFLGALVDDGILVVGMSPARPA